MHIYIDYYTLQRHNLQWEKSVRNGFSHHSVFPDCAPQKFCCDSMLCFNSQLPNCTLVYFLCWFPGVISSSQGEKGKTRVKQKPSVVEHRKKQESLNEIEKVSAVAIT